MPQREPNEKIISRIIFDLEKNTFYCQQVNKDNQIIGDDCKEILDEFGVVFKNRLGNVDRKHREYAVLQKERKIYFD